MIILFIAQLLLLIVVIVVLVIWTQSLITLVQVKVPFVPVPKAALKEIIVALDLKEGSVLYDLGCGDGRVLFAAYRADPNVSCVGIEKSWLPLFLARLKLFLMGKNRNITVLNKNFFQHDVSSATHVFVYLYSRVMDDLLLKLQKELKPGTRVVSCSFPFSDKKPLVVVDLNRRPNQLAQQLYVYEF